MTGVVGDDEQVFRRIRKQVADQTCYKVEKGKLIFSSTAFNDPAKSPSFDRAVLKHLCDPHLSRKSSADGVVSLRTGDIRNLGPIPRNDGKGRPVGKHAVDVVPNPRIGNCSHALVVTRDNPANSVFKRLKEALARLADQAGWTVEPDCDLPERHGNQLQDGVKCLVNRARGRI